MATSGSSTNRPDLIECSHILHDHAHRYESIEIGKGAFEETRIVVLCELCHAALVGRVLKSVITEAIQKEARKILRK